MDDYENAILSLFTSFANEKQKSECDRMKNDVCNMELHWQLAVESKYEQVQFYGLQAIFDNIQKLDTDRRMNMKNGILLQIQQNNEMSLMSVHYLRLKLAGIVVKLVRLEYLRGWPNAFSEIENTGIMFYYTVMQIVYEEIVEVQDDGCIEMNMKIKDRIRETSVVADFMKNSTALVVNDVRDGKLEKVVESALGTVKNYIAWIDIRLVLEEQWIQGLYGLMKSDKGRLKGKAANCLCEMVNKKMPSENKIELMLKLNIVQVLKNLELYTMGEQVGTLTIDDKFGEEIAELVNALGIELIFALQKPTVQHTAHQLLTDLMPILWCCFGHDQKDVSEEVLDLVNGIANMLKDENNYGGFQASMYLPQLLFGISRQIRYSGDDKDVDEAEFDQYRRSLRKVYGNIVRHRPQVVISFLCEIMQRALNNVPTMDAVDFEATLALLFHFGEAVSVNGGIALTTEGPFKEMVIAVHAKVLSNDPHFRNVLQTPIVILMYLDVAVRYVKSLPDNMIGPLLEKIVGDCCLCHPMAHVRSRSVYLLLRLLKALSAKVNTQHIGLVLSNMQESMVVHLDTKTNSKFSHQDQQYVFEIIGLLIGANRSMINDPVVQLEYLKLALAPHVQSIEQCLADVSNVQENVVEWQARVVGALSHILKGFKKVQNEQQIIAFKSLLDLCIKLLSALPNMPTIRSSIMFLTHRMVVVLENAFIEHLPSLLDLLIPHTRVEDIMEVVQLLNQIALKFGNKFASIIQPRFMFIIQHFCSLLPAAPSITSSSDHTVTAMTCADIDRVTVQKFLYSFIYHIASVESLNEVFLSESNVPHLENILKLVQDGFSDATDLSINRTCLSIMVVLFKKWTSENSNIAKHTKRSVIEYMVTQIAPIAFKIGQKQHFNYTDGQSMGLVKECVSFLKCLDEVLGSEFQSYLVGVLFPTFQLSPTIGIEFCNQLSTNDTTSLRPIFIVRTHFHISSTWLIVY